MSNTYTMDEYFETRERDQIIDGLLKNIGPSNPLRPHMNVGREEKVIRMLVGMEPYSRSYTEKEIAVELDVSKSRVTILVDTILRKLRHPGYKLREHLDFEPWM